MNKIHKIIIFLNVYFACHSDFSVFFDFKPRVKVSQWFIHSNHTNVQQKLSFSTWISLWFFKANILLIRKSCIFADTNSHLQILIEKLNRYCSYCRNFKTVLSFRCVVVRSLFVYVLINLNFTESLNDPAFKVTSHGMEWVTEIFDGWL